MTHAWAAALCFYLNSRFCKLSTLSYEKSRHAYEGVTSRTQVWAAALCFYLNNRFRDMGTTSIVFVVTTLLCILAPLCAIVVAYAHNWQLVATVAVSVGVYVW